MAKWPFQNLDTFMLQTYGMRKKETEAITLTDRIALAFLSAVSSFITGSVIWFVIVFSYKYVAGAVLIPFYPVYMFSGLMAILGFVTTSNICVDILGWLWQFAYKLLLSAR